ncbi:MULTISPECIES: DUF397 domain-containing protein [Streptosporangium]|uniref:DUF397 domain-containing protein n=1 Tax=Streptosporangium jomthongense TaxID=1193683 RepID=A0ABV8F526_9ACTN
MNTWRKSSLSGSDGGDCVEVAHLNGLTAIRDSKNPTGPTLTLTPAQWRSFIGHLKADA